MPQNLLEKPAHRETNRSPDGAIGRSMILISALILALGVNKFISADADRTDREITSITEDSRMRFLYDEVSTQLEERAPLPLVDSTFGSLERQRQMTRPLPPRIRKNVPFLG